MTEGLKGKGIPIGIDAAYRFQVNEKAGLAEWQVVVFSTDGIWEARHRN